MARVVYVLWSPQTGPICAYEDAVLAAEHAQTMLGVEVSRIELRDELPEVAKADTSDYEEDQTTPIDLEDIDG